MDADQNARPLSGLFADLQRATLRLIQQEIALAKAEMGERIGQLAVGLGLMVAAILVLFVALLIVLMGLSELVGKFMPAPLALWLGYLIVGGVTMFAGLWLAKLAIGNLRNAGQFLTRTSRSLRGDFAALERELP
jgi:Putative Actinobacterial Holin-X, holin superfamily III